MSHFNRSTFQAGLAGLVLAASPLIGWSQPGGGGQFPPRLTTPAPAPLGSSAPLGSQANQGVIEVKGGFVTAKKDVELASPEAGILSKTEVKLGDEVEAGTLLASMLDIDAQIKVEAALAELSVAETQAASEAEIVAAVHTVGVSKAEYETSLNIRKKNPDAISDTQVRRDELQWRKAIAQEGVARMEHEMHGKTVGVKKAQWKAAKNELDKRQIKASVNGVIEDIYKDEGEWCPLGERLIRVVQMDSLRVVGFVPAKQGHQDDVIGRQVDVAILLPNREKPEHLTGVIDFASPVVANNEYRIHVDIDNIKDPRTGRWMISPGVRADMKINMTQPAVSRATAAREASR